jgi:hypothetical protein
MEDTTVSFLIFYSVSGNKGIAPHLSGHHDSQGLDIVAHVSICFFNNPEPGSIMKNCAVFLVISNPVECRLWKGIKF